MAPAAETDSPATPSTAAWPKRVSATVRSWGDPRLAWSWRRDALAMALLALGTIFLRWPHRSRYLNGWDSTSLALALVDYDVLAQQPHAPGYPVYVLVGRFFYALLGEANTALVAEGIAFSAVAVALLYGFMREFGSVRAALGATILFALAPVFVFNGVIALSYTSEAAASVGVAWLAWRLKLRPSNRAALLLGAVFALALGLRPSLLFFLTPLVILAVAAPPRHVPTLARRAGAAGLGAAAAGLAWFFPMALATTGGLDGLRRANAIQGGWVVFNESVFTGGWTALEDHAERLRFFLTSEETWLLPLGLLFLALGWIAARPHFRARDAVAWPRGAATFLATWLLPATLFYLLVFDGWDKGPTGYVLVILPGVYALFAWLVDAALRANEIAPRHAASPRAAAWLAPVLLLAPAPGLVGDWDTWLEKEVVAHDEWADHWNGIRTNYPPNETAILTFYSWYHVKWYFPDYLVWGYFPIPRSQEPPDWELFLETRNHADDVLYYEGHERGPGQAPHAVPPHIRHVLVFDFQLAGENGGPRRLRDDVNVTAATLDNGWRVLVFDPTPDKATIESYFRPLD